MTSADIGKRHLSSLEALTSSKSLYQFGDPVSPHIAARTSVGISDDEIRASVYDELHSYADREGQALAVVEGAGGVLSPSPSGTPQADLYRPLRLPALLIGDHKLGGIGTTISAWESLHVRGYDVQGVALFSEHRYENYAYLRQYFADREVACYSIDPPPNRVTDQVVDAQVMRRYHEDASHRSEIADFTTGFLRNHERRIDYLQQMPRRANESIWHPFLQHRERSEDNIVAIDSAYSDFFQTYTTQRDPAPQASVLKPALDGSASWWTQGLGHGNPRLALTAAHAAGRYGHVMFASAVHEPALKLAETLIKSMRNPRLSKVFYTDNGSTGMEVAIKMALRAAAVRNEWSAEEEISILGLTNSYHGDTIGTMDCSEPSVFNKKVEWYRGRGHWLDFPQVKMRKGKWLIQGPEGLGGTKEFDSLNEIFDLEGRVEDTERYRAHLDAELHRLRSQGVKLGALIVEPIILGAGGMLFADPLFQLCLVNAVRSSPPPSRTNPHSADKLDWQGTPVIFDEVFTGLYRLGRFSAASFLGVEPDIVVNAKLLTGGMLPLCTTTASEAIFGAFLSDEKSDALLHGHSYTAHAVGCAVATESLKEMDKLARENGEWESFRQGWMNRGECDRQIRQPSAPISAGGSVWSMWSEPFVRSLSHKSSIDSVFAIGSVLAISLADPGGQGYASTAGTGLRDRLLAGEKADEWVIHSRVLGNVLYLMAAMNTKQEVLMEVQEKVLRQL